MPVHVLHRLPEALVTDRPRGPPSLGQQVVPWISAFAQLSQELGGMPALGASARALHARLDAVWPPEVMALPYYPVFHRW